MKLVVIDYDSGNLRSVSRALESQGVTPLVTGDAAEFDAADAIVLPGVGSGPAAMNALNQRSLVGPIRDYIASGRPFLGICLGLQCAIIEFARNVCGLSEAGSVEFSRTPTDPVICLMDSQLNVTSKGGTMRLGEYPASLREGSRALDIYAEKEIHERHRHRYEVNNAYREQLEEHGLMMSGTSPDNNLVEMIEIPAHPWFMGCQFSPPS